jgi:acyl-CoA thioesterase-1
MALSVCVFGDSVSRGVVFDSLLDRYTLLKDSFVNCVHSVSGINIRNYSKFGSTVTKGLEMLRRHMDELKNYDYIVLEFGGNDCDYNWAEISAEPDREHTPNTPPALFTQKYGQLISDVKRSGSRPVLLTLPPIDAPRYFAWVSRGLNASNILKWLGDVEHIYRWHELYNLAVCRLAHDWGVPLIDISSSFLAAGDYQKFICQDGIHPNESGHRLISQTINETLRQLRPATA